MLFSYKTILFPLKRCLLFANTIFKQITYITWMKWEIIDMVDSFLFLVNVWVYNYSLKLQGRGEWTFFCFCGNFWTWGWFLAMNFSRLLCQLQLENEKSFFPTLLDSNIMKEELNSWENVSKSNFQRTKRCVDRIFSFLELSSVFNQAQN